MTPHETHLIYISCGSHLLLPSLLPCCLRLARYITATHPREKAFVKNKWAYQAKRTFIIGEVKALMPKFLFMSMEILPVIMNLIIKASKKRSQIHPGRCYERSKKNRDRKHIHTRKSVL